MKITPAAVALLISIFIFKFFVIHDEYEKRMAKYFAHARSWKEKGIALADKNDYANSYDWSGDFRAHELFEQYYNRFEQEFAGTPYLEALEKTYAPSRRLQPGAPVPDFAFVSLDDPKKVITKKSLLGKNYIIDFWALWCGPCKPALEELSVIHERFRAQDFTILSVSMDYKKEDVVDYRKRILPMPWLHAHLEGWKPNQGVLYDFEVATIPKIILVDKNGVIVAINERGENLYKSVGALVGR